MSIFDFNRDGEVSSSEQAFGLGAILAALSETEAEVKITIKASTGGDEDYATGESKLADSAQQDEQKTATVTPTPSPEPEKQEPATGSETSQADYILNTNTKKFHYPTCSSVNDMKEKNKQEFFGTRDEAISNGYSPCGRCKP